MPNIFDLKLVFTQIPELLKYLPMTLEITILSMILGLIIGLVLAMIKIKQIPVLTCIKTNYCYICFIYKRYSYYSSIISNLLWNTDHTKILQLL